MSDRELKTRKKAQAATWRTTGALGVTGAALGTAGIVASKKPGVLKPVNNALKKLPAGKHKVTGLPKERKATGQGLTNAGIYTGLVGGGIGGAGSFNSAKISADEAKRRKMVRKSQYDQVEPTGFEPVFGEIGKAANWTPVNPNVYPEVRREKRNRTLQAGLTGTSTAAGIGAGVAAASEAKGVTAAAKKAGQVKRTSTKLKHLKNAAGKGKGTLALTGLAAGTAGGAALVGSRRNNK